MDTASHSKIVEDENYKLRTEVSRLSQENASLRAKLAKAEQNSQPSEQRVTLLEGERKHLEFMPSPSKYDQYVLDESQLESKHDTPESDDPIIDIYPFVSNDPEERISQSPISPGTLSKQVDSHYGLDPTIDALDNLAFHDTTLGQYELAEKMCKGALGGANPDHPDVATIVSRDGEIHDRQSNHIETENSSNGGLVIREKSLGKDHILVAKSLNNLAEAYEKRGIYSDAEQLRKRALEIREKVQGKDHPDVGILLNDLGVLYYDQKKYEEAERYYQQAIEIYVSKLEPDDRLIVQTKNNLALCYLAQDKCMEVEILYKDIITRYLEK